MIRDEYNNQVNAANTANGSIRDEYVSQTKTKKISLKEAEGVRKEGARVYYSSRIPKLRDGIRVYKFSAWFVLIMGVILTALVVASYLVREQVPLDAWFYVYASCAAVFIIYSLLCFLVFIPVTKKKIERFTNTLTEVNEVDSVKRNAAYEYLLRTKNTNEQKND